jgi:SAM-dependent methyltransferase
MNLKSIIGRNNELVRLDWLEKKLRNIQPGKRLLDAGAGELRNKQFCQHLNYVSQDLCQYEGKGDGIGLQTGNWDTRKIDIVSDISQIPVGDQSFDIVLCTEVLEHVPDPVSAVKELCRIVKPGGEMIITAPFASLTHFAPYHFSSGLSRYWYTHHLSRLGFDVIQIQPNGGWFDFIAQEIWRLPWVGKTYSSWLIGWVALLSSIPLMFLIWMMRKYDNRSSEMLTFGWQIVAKKRL